jgi:hypothetical protein
MRIAIVFVAAMLTSAWAQDIKMPAAFDKLAAKAESHVEVTVDSNMLQLAGKFLSDKDADQAKAKKTVAGLKGIYIRSFEFANEGEYSAADVDAFRAQLRAPTWSRIVGATSKRGGEIDEVYFKTSAGSQIGGLVIIAAQPKELTIVSITGTISVDDLADLGGQFGIPKVELPKSKGKEE